MKDVLDSLLARQSQHRKEASALQSRELHLEAELRTVREAKAAAVARSEELDHVLAALQPPLKHPSSPA